MSRGRHRRAPSLLLAGLLAVTGGTVLAVAWQSPDTSHGASVEPRRSLSPLPSPNPVASVTARPSAYAMSRSLPVTLEIPALGVRSSLLSLGQAADGSLEVPPPGPHYDQAGWYRYSPTPGSLGPAVIAGHVDSKAGGPSVFYRLGGLRPHDRVLVRRADGTVAVFAVDAVRRFAKAAFPTRLVYGDTDHPALRLITCGGVFDRSTGHYRDNVVVTASLVDQAPS